MTTDPRSQEHPMSEQDPTAPSLLEERLIAATRAGRRRPKPHFIPIFHRPSDLTADPADDTMAGLMSRPFIYTPPDREAERAVREALPICAPGIEVDQVLAAMPAWQSQAATLRALKALVAEQYVTRQQDHGQRSAFYRPVPHPSRTDHASTSPPSRVEPGLWVGTPQRGKTTWPGVAGVQWRMELSAAVHQALPTHAPGITAEQVHHRVGNDVEVVEVAAALCHLVADGAAISDDIQGAITYRRHDEGEQP